MEHVGIDNVKKMAHFVVGMMNAMGSAWADQKFDVMDLAYFVKPMMDLGPAFAGAKGCFPELKDLDAAERDDLMAYIKGELKVPEVKAEASLEQLLALMGKFHEIYLLLKK